MTVESVRTDIFAVDFTQGRIQIFCVAIELKIKKEKRCDFPPFYRNFLWRFFDILILLGPIFPKICLFPDESIPTLNFLVMTNFFLANFSFEFLNVLSFFHFFFWYYVFFSISLKCFPNNFVHFAC